LRHWHLVAKQTSGDVVSLFKVVPNWISNCPAPASLPLFLYCLVSGQVVSVDFVFVELILGFKNSVAKMTLTRKFTLHALAKKLVSLPVVALEKGFISVEKKIIRTSNSLAQ
jgi:hypothetical protein